MNERTMQLRIGATVLASLVILGIMMTFLGLHDRMMSGSYNIFISMNEAPGVTENSPISQSGITIGRVKKVELTEDRKVLITARIKNNHKLYHDQIFQLAATLLGDASLKVIRPAPENGTIKQPTTEVKPGETMHGEVAFDPVVLIGKIQKDVTAAIKDVSSAAQKMDKLAGHMDNTLNENSENLGKVLENARVITDKSRNFVEDASDFFGDETTRGQVRDTIQRLPGTLATVEKTFKDIDGTFQKVNLTLEQVNTRVNTSLDMMDTSLKDIRGVTAPLVANIERWSAHLDSIILNTMTFTEALNSKESTLGLFLNDRGVYDDVRETLGRVKYVSRELEPILGNVKLFTEKIAEHPELLGVRGAFFPDRGKSKMPSWPFGVKEPETVYYQSPYGTLGKTFIMPETTEKKAYTSSGPGYASHEKSRHSSYSSRGSVADAGTTPHFKSSYSSTHPFTYPKRTPDVVTDNSDMSMFTSVNTPRVTPPSATAKSDSIHGQKPSRNVPSVMQYDTPGGSYSGNGRDYPVQLRPGETRVISDVVVARDGKPVRQDSPPSGEVVSVIEMNPENQDVFTLAPASTTPAPRSAFRMPFTK